MSHEKTWDELRQGGRRRSRLTETDVADIHALYATGDYRHSDIAEQYGVTRVWITSILNGRGPTWNVVPASGMPLGNGMPASRGGLAFPVWARRRGYSEERIAAEEARIAPPLRHICEPGTVCCAAVEGYVADAVDEAAD